MHKSTRWTRNDHGISNWGHLPTKLAMGMTGAVAVLAVSTTARAGTVTVNTTTPNSSTDGKCGLVEAVTAINQQASYRSCYYPSGTDRIVFSVNGTHSVSGLTLQRSVTITGNGPASTIIRATNTVGITVSGQSSGTQTVSLRDLRITTDANFAYSFGVTGTSSNPVNVYFNDAVVDGFGIGGYFAGDACTAGVFNSVFENNNAGLSMSGGGVQVSFSTFRNNDSGGLRIYNYSTPRYSYVYDSLFENNHAYDGGGIYVSSYDDPGQSWPSLYVNRTDFVGNSATRHGGGLYAAASIEIEGSSFVDNSAGNTGGGMIAHERSSFASVYVEVDTTTFERNTALRGGGYANYGPSDGQRVKAMLLNSTFGPSNVASGDGGGIYSVSQIDVAENLTIYNNTAARGGGLFHDSGGESHVFHSTITNNTATQTNGGGGLWLVTGNPIYAYNIIAYNWAGTTSSNVVTTNPSLNAKYNLLSSTSGIPLGIFPTQNSGGTNIVAPPRLSGFGSYGGPTKTRRPRADSPAIDAIPVSDGDWTTTDQRLWFRPMDGDSDGVAENHIGAVEYEL